MYAAYEGLARTIYMWCLVFVSILGRAITNYTVICGALIRFWPTLCTRICHISGYLNSVIAVQQTHSKCTFTRKYKKRVGPMNIKPGGNDARADRGLLLIIGACCLLVGLVSAVKPGLA
jgi:hypothetical protein